MAQFVQYLTDFFLSRELALNLAAEIVGILLTVFLIDRLFRWREHRKWNRIRQRVYRRIALRTDAFLSEVAAAGARPPGAHPTDYTKDGKPRSPSYILREYFATLVRPRLLRLSEEQWRHIAKSARNLREELHHLADSYFDLLEPQLLTRILEVEEIAGQLLELSSLFDLGTIVQFEPELLANTLEKLVTTIDALEKRPEIPTRRELPYRFLT